MFSARTTEEGLKALNELNARLKVSWDDLVIDAVCAHYGLAKVVMALPKPGKPAKKAEQAVQATATEEVNGASGQDSVGAGVDSSSADGAPAPAKAEARTKSRQGAPTARNGARRARKQ